jgi:hypothetical protein
MISTSQNNMTMIDEYLLGQYKDDKKNGKGKFRYANGQVKEGIWSNGNFIG